MNDGLKALEGVDAPSLNKFWEWVGRTFTPYYRKEIEDYLNESVDHCDAEQRIKNLARRGMI
jgi:predicted DNA-binding protein